MFTTFKNLDQAFRQLRRITILSIAAGGLTAMLTVFASYHFALRGLGRVYILSDGKVLEAYAADRGENLPAEARDHVCRFHQLMFALDPDEKLIAGNVARALYLADRSGKQVADNLRESGYLNGIVAGNISQRLDIDSIVLDADRWPAHFRCYAREQIVRTSTITVRALVTEGWLRRVKRSDNDPHGFLIERFAILDNHDIETQPRGFEK